MTAGYPVVLLSLLPVVAVGLRSLDLQQLRGAVAGVALLTLALTPASHKEHRFLLPVMPVPGRDGTPLRNTFRSIVFERISI